MQKVKKETSTKKQSLKGNKKVKIIAFIIGGCLLCCSCSAIVGGIGWWYYQNRGKGVGPVYNESPVVNILEPTGSSWYATYENSIKLSGIASDDEDNIQSVEWAVEGGESGSASGTVKWESDSVPLNEGDNKITIKAYDKDGNSGEDVIFVVYNKEIVFVEEPTINPDYIFKNDPPVDITFQAMITNESDKELSQVALYKVDEKGELVEKVGDMKDSGNVEDGDDIPSDGSYGYQGPFSSETSDPIYFRMTVKLEGSDTSGLSGVIKLTVVEHMSQQTMQEIDDLNQQVNDLVGQLEQQGASQGEIAQEVNDLVGQQEGIEGNGISEQGQGVWWVYENTCIPGGVIFNPPGTRGGEASEKGYLKTFEKKTVLGISDKVKAQSDITVDSTKAIYLGPYLNDFGEYDDYYGAWEKIKESTCPQCETVEKKNTEVTVDDFKNLDQYGLIVVSSHGDNWYGGLSGDSMCAEGLTQSQVIIYTSQKLTSENLAQYEADLMARRLAVGADSNLVILPSYISHYNNNFPSSLVYIATCRSSYNNSLASAFLGDGAKAYYGFDDYVLSSYCYDVGVELFSSFVLDGANASSSYSVTTFEAGGNDGQGANFTWSGEGSLKMGGKGFINLDFAGGSLNGWAASGDARVITSLGSINPRNGSFMGIISTGLGSVSDSTSSISQSICSPGGSGVLKFDYNLVSEEPMEYVVGQFDDRLEVSLIVDGSSTTVLSAGVTDSEWLSISGIDFAGGDETTYYTGWKTLSYSLEDIDSNAQVELKFEVSDVGDSDFDTAALIDDIRVE